MVEKNLFSPSEEKLKSSWNDVSGFVKVLLHIHDSIEKRKVHTKSPKVYMYFSMRKAR